jgi:hypothetical protein
MSKTLGLSAKQWKILLHYPMLAALLTAYYVYIHPPVIGASILNMFAELSILLLVADQFIHKIIIRTD